MKCPNVYLYQNVFSIFFDTPVWREHPIAKVLLAATAEGRIHIWASPTHVIEISQAIDPDRRRGIARIILELISGKRMLSGPDFILLQHFGDFLNSVVPGSYDPSKYIDRYSETAQHAWLGNLALLTLDCPIQLGSGINEIRRAKLENRLIHARLFSDPDKSIETIIECASSFTTTTNQDPLGLEKLSDSEIIEEISRLQPSIKRPKSETISKLQKHRREIVERYAAIDIGSVLRSIFGQYPFDLELTFNIPSIVAHWASFANKYSVPLLPEAVMKATEDQLRCDRNMVASVLNATIVAAAFAHLSAASIGYYSLMREFEVCFNENKLPTAGAGFDVDHASAVYYHDIFICRDHTLAESVKTYAKKISKDISVVTDERQLINAIQDWNVRA